MIELINPYIAKIVISTVDGDSIRQVSRKIKESYGWTYKWVLELEKAGVLKRKGQEIFLNKNNWFYQEIKKLVKKSFRYNLSLSDAYLLPNLSGLDYIFTNTDAVFIWTKGGYNIGRNKNSYPIFMDILEKDKSDWEKFFSRINIFYTFKNERKKRIYFVISIKDKIEKEYSDGVPILPLAKTVEWAKEYRFNFEPALEMLDRMYDLKIGIKYAEIE